MGGYYLAGEKSGTLSFTAPDEPGDYEFRLFEDDGYTDIARSNIVRVQEGTTVSTPTPTPTTPSDGGLVGYWNFNEGSGNIAYDSSGSGNDGTIHGATWVDNGSCEKALSFDGVDDYVKTNPATFQSNDITVEAWIYPKSFSILGYSENILRKGAIGTNNFLFELLLYPNKIIAFRISNNGNNCNSIVGTTSLELNKWYHVVGVYRSSDKFFAVYVNGTEDNSKTSRLSSLYHDASKYRIGARYDYRHFGSGRDFNGIIDEVRIYDRALSEEEIQADMNECAPKSTLPDLSGKGDCEGAGGYWYNNQCNEEEEESGYGDLKVTYISREEVQEKYTVSYDETFKYDDDGDGANEATLYYKGENNLVMSSDDTDKDGKVDLIFHYDDEEFLMRAIRDTDGDGELDQILHFNREEEIIKVEKIRSDDTKNSSLFITLGGIIIFIVMCFWLYVTKKQPCNLRMNELNYIGRVNPQVGKRLFLISIAFLSILVLLVSPVSSLEDVIDDDCNIKEDVWDRDWKKYSDLENTPLTFEERPLTSRSPQTRQYYATQSEIVDAKLQIFFLRRDMEIDRLMRVELNEYKKELVDVHRDNLLKSFMRLSFLTAHVTVEAVIAGKSVGGSYNNIVAPPSHVSTVASSLKIWGALDTMAKDSETPSLEDKTQDATEVVMGAGVNVALDAVEGLGDPKTVGTAFVTQTIGAIPIKYKGKEWMLTEEDFEILEEAHLELKGIDMAWADSFEANLERLDKVKELEAQIKELEKELAKREAKVKSMHACSDKRLTSQLLTHFI